jgi:hypothetical protein
MASRSTVRIVSPAEAAVSPYPYVHINHDGSARELHPKEWEYLETPFDPFDGGRPYVKSSYEDKTPSGDVWGFCPRSMLPSGLPVAPPPVSDPKQMWREDHIASLKKKMPQYDFIENPDGTISARRRNDGGASQGAPKTWWSRLRRWLRLSRRAWTCLPVQVAEA